MGESKEIIDWLGCFALSYIFENALDLIYVVWVGIQGTDNMIS